MQYFKDKYNLNLKQNIQAYNKIEHCQIIIKFVCSKKISTNKFKKIKFLYCFVQQEKKNKHVENNLFRNSKLYFPI